jgi:two-component system response regulator MprA
MVKILVVDDEAPLRELIVEVLTDAGYAVAAAATGSAAMDQVTRNRPDLILLDLMMPELDGRATVHHLRARAELATIPVVLMSASRGAAGVAAALQTSFVAKPFDLDRLLTVVAASLAVPPLP